MRAGSTRDSSSIARYHLGQLATTLGPIWRGWGREPLSWLWWTGPCARVPSESYIDLGLANTQSRSQDSDSVSHHLNLLIGCCKGALSQCKSHDARGGFGTACKSRSDTCALFAQRCVVIGRRKSRTQPYFLTHTHDIPPYRPVLLPPPSVRATVGRPCTHLTQPSTEHPNRPRQKA